MYKEVISWLRTQSLFIEENHLRLRLESHPDFPSLLAVQDSLAELNIISYACQGTKEELKIENKPFLAHFNMGEGQVLYFENLATAEQKIKDFDKYWSGNVMFLEPAKEYGNAAHTQQYKKEKLTKLFGLFAIVLVIGALAGLAIAVGTIATVVLTISNLIGLYFSWLIAQKEFGISNSVSDKICSMAKHSRCESVLFSKGAKLFSWLSWGDVGIVYFSTSLLYLASILFTGNFNGLQMFYLISLAGLIFPIYSLYYQWKVVKQWCMLCIGVLAALAIAGVVSAMGLYLPFASVGMVQFFLLFIFLMAVTLSAWQLIKSVYQKGLSSLTNEIKATRLKRNPEIFNALLQRQETKIINLPEQDEAIQFGNPTAPYQLVIACNPYCGPCAKAHHAIEELYEKHPDKIAVAVRFALQVNDDKNNNVITVKEILKVAKANPLTAVKDWYSMMNLEAFKKRHSTNGEQVDTFIDKHIAWAKEVSISGTPTFFVNGRKLPELYSWVDFIKTLEYDIKN